MKIGIKNCKLFLKRTERILLGAGFKRTVESDKYLLYEWVKETKFGTVYFRPDNDPKSPVYSIFGKFKNTDLANEILVNNNGNTYSGKCNIHEFAENGPELPCEQLELLIQKLN
jgi:hypothetical protein